VYLRCPDQKKMGYNPSPVFHKERKEDTEVAYNKGKEPRQNMAAHHYVGKRQFCEC
jgi:hypothetical protein